MIGRAIEIMQFYRNWPVKFLNHRFISDKPILFKLRNGLIVKAESNTDDDGIIEEIFTKNPYTPLGFEIKPGDIVFDVGAQKGIFTLYAASKGSIVHSYEPLPKNFKFLLENLKLNAFNAKAQQLALSSKAGYQNFYLSTGSGSHSLLFKTSNIIKVKTSTLDVELKKHKIKQIDLLKLDCEGAEFQILYSTKNLSKIRKIAMEYHESVENKIDELANYLKENGFFVTIRKNYLYAIRNQNKYKFI